MSFFDYFQIISVVLFVGIIVAKTLYLRLVRGINPIALGGGKTGLVLAVEIFAFTALLTWLLEIIFYATHSKFRIYVWPFNLQLISSRWASMVGVALTSVGFILFAFAYVDFGDSWRVGFDVKRPGALVTSGVFSISRNPIYFFLDLWFLSAFLINGTLIFLILAALAFLAQHWQILQEEAFLSNLYGESFRNYCRRTRRYL